MDTDSEHIQPSREPCPSAAKYCHLAGTETASSKAIPPCYEDRYFRMVRNLVIQVNSMSMGPLSHFRSKVNSLIRNNAVWNSM